jgi:hypothetical protein
VNLQRLFVVLRLALGTAVATVIAIASAREWKARERAGWDPHYGDPDGESIVDVVGLLLGVGVFLAVAAVVAGVELALWLRRRAVRAAAHLDGDAVA